jgi:uncharacterized delta-60 repeat protein
LKPQGIGVHLLKSYIPRLFLVIAISIWLIACGGGNDKNASDTTPDAFHFVDQSDVAPDTLITSNSISVSWIDTAAAISVTDGEYAIDDGVFTRSDGTVSNGQTVTVRHTSSAFFSSATTTLLRIGDARGSFTSTTKPADTTPHVFSFVDQTDVAPNTVITSNRIIISGIDTAVPISVTNGEYAIDDGAFTNAAGTVTQGQTITVRHTSSSSYMTMTLTVISIGSVSGGFASTTGPIGTGFNKASGFNHSVTSISPATDGSGDIYVGGYFTVYNNSYSRGFIRLNKDGTVDTAFDPIIDVSELNIIIPAIDGSGDIYVGGDFFGYATTLSNYSYRGIQRLNSNGSTDITFGVGSGFNDTVTTIAPATDGSGDIYVGGAFTNYDGTTSNCIIRLNSDGSVDATFGVGSGFNNTVKTIAPATDGSGDIYVGGFFEAYNGTSSRYIIRLNSDGSVDTTFAVGTGFNDLDMSLGGGGPCPVCSIAPTTDGSGDIYVGGNFYGYNDTQSKGIIRLHADGTTDTAFGGGIGFDSIFDYVKTISFIPDGSGDIYVGGQFTAYHGSVSPGVIRLNSDGTIDTTFSVGSGFDPGINSFEFPNYVVNTISLVSDGSGDLYAGGYFSAYKGTGRNNILRLSSNGIVDTTFVAGSGFDSSVSSINPATDGSGDIYASGDFHAYNGSASNGMIRLNSDGTMDTSFDVGIDLDYSDGFIHPRIIPATDGSGDVYVGDGSRIIRLNSDGTVDTTFDAGSGFVDFSVHSINPATDGSGDVYVGGGRPIHFGSFNKGIIRLNSDGTVDTAFDVGTGFDSSVRIISPATDGSGDIYVGGYFTAYNGSASKGIIRLNSDGTVDTTFDVGNGFIGSEINSISPATDGSGDIYVGGSFDAYNGTASRNIIRLNSDGTVDTMFAVGSGFDSTVYSICPATDGSGKIYVGGYFGAYNGSTSSRLVRLNSDGTIDEEFFVWNGFNNVIYALSLAPDDSGDLYVGGDFSSYKDSVVNGIARLNPDGSLN